MKQSTFILIVGIGVLIIAGVLYFTRLRTDPPQPGAYSTILPTAPTAADAEKKDTVNIVINKSDARVVLANFQTEINVINYEANQIFKKWPDLKPQSAPAQPGKK